MRIHSERTCTSASCNRKRVGGLAHGALIAKRAAIAVAVLSAAVPCLGRPQRNKKVVSTARLGNVLYCLQAKASSFGYAPPRFEPSSFRVRYVYGKWSPVDEDDELHMVVYGPREESATLFEVYLQTVGGKQGIFIGDAATLKSKREKGRLVTDEIPGGQATLLRIESLLVHISHRRAIRIMDSEVKSGPAACVYQP
jgi:hypothetical protein